MKTGQGAWFRCLVVLLTLVIWTAMRFIVDIEIIDGRALGGHLGREQQRPM